MDDRSPDERLTAFIAAYTPEIGELAQAARERMRAHLPGAFELVYDNYNALAIGFGPSDKTGEAIFSIALYPRWVSLFFLKGATLPDPDGVLKGSGKVARHIVLKSAADLDTPPIQALIAGALESAAVPLDATSSGRLIIKSVSKKQRPRRP